MSRFKRIKNLPDSLSDWTVEQLQAELARCQTRVRFFEHIGQGRGLKETLKRVGQVEKVLAEKLNACD